MIRQALDRSIRALPLKVRDRLAHLLAASLTGKSRASLLETLAFKEPAKFLPAVQCSVHSKREFARSQKVIDAPILEWLGMLKAGDVFYDIGANIGMFSLYVAKHLSGTVKVVAFEPSSPTYSTLMRNVALNGMQSTITCFEFALGAKTGAGQFNYNDLDPGGALHALDSRVDYKREAFEPVFSQPIMGYRLDDVIANFNLPAPTHLKIDVDGTEPDVLAGAAKALAGAKSVLIEIVDVEENDPRTAGIVAQISQAGLSHEKVIYHADKGKFPRITDYVFTRARAGN